MHLLSFRLSVGFVVTATFALFCGSVLSKEPLTALAQDFKPTTQQQLLWLDLEILVLKAELAQKSGDAKAVKHYLDELQKAPLASHLNDRITQLKAYVAKQPVEEAQTQFAFDARTPLVLLPLSGPYQVAGSQILAGLQSALPEVTLQVIDTAIYDSAFELWELVKLYQPSFIFGPLRPEFAQAFAQLDTQIPTLMFNEVVSSDDNVRFLSPNRSAQMPSLVNSLQNGSYRKVLLLTASKQLPQLEAFIKAEQDLPEAVKFDWVEAPLKVSIDQTLEQALGALASESRRVWLQKTLGERIEEGVRARQDIDLVVSFLPFRSAMQVSPILNYYHLNQVPHLWIPTELPSIEVFSANLPFWQSTQAMLPKLYINQVLQAKSHERSSASASPQNYVLSTVSTSQNQTVGIFYALGQVAAEMVQEMAISPLQQMSTPLGKVQWDEAKNIQIIPSYYWLDKGVVSEQTP